MLECGVLPVAILTGSLPADDSLQSRLASPQKARDGAPREVARVSCLPCSTDFGDTTLPSRELALPMDEPSDRALMDRVARGDRDAFATLYRRYERPLFGFLFRVGGVRPLAEDLLQETFTRVWLAARTFDAARGQLRPWLYRVALNVARSELGKKRHSITHVPLDAGMELTSDNEGEMGEQIDAAARAQAVAQAVAELPAFMREVVVLRCYQQLSFGEIAEVTGAPTGTLKSRFHRALAALRAALGAGEGSDEG
jgi:RNA polymerase sigma-70 factor (ECF subfamily)